MLANKTKGFSMLELLASLVLISGLMIVSLRSTNNLNLDHYYFLNEYLEKQSEAILNKADESLGNGVSFNSMGRVNQARTIEFKNHSIIIHLGNGYATCE